MSCKEYMSVKDLRNELDSYDGNMEAKIFINHEEYDIYDLDISVKGEEPKLLIKCS